ncbi:MAG: class I SAM-dependent methyltransferase [Desulfobacteraceae bacterium]|nr:class I SAM-dependent methyltransferase [Desulfobacteraceae bacterium]
MMDKTTLAYDNNAAKYADKFMSFAPYGEKIRRFRDRYVKENSTLLDLGCGPGNNAAILSRMEGVRITGLDLSREMVRLAKAHVPEGDFRVTDLRELDFKEHCDVVVASFCIVHLTLEETASLIRKIGTILKSGGHLYLSFMEGRGQGFETTSFSEDEIFFNYYDRDTITALLAQNHLAVVETLEGEYEEQDGSVTTDIFMVAQGSADC